MNPADSPARPPSARVYPEWIEQGWVREAQRHIGVADPAEALPRFTRAVAVLSDLFTIARPAVSARTPRPAFPDYGADPALAIAYGLFFFPQNWVRARLPLAEAIDFRGWRPRGDSAQPRCLRVLDLGAGAGAAGLGAALLLRERALADEIELTAVDRSAASLGRLAALAREHAGHLPGLRVRTVAHDALDWARRELPRADAPFDLIVLGFALNEMLPPAAGLEARVEFAHRLRRALADAGLLLLLEPALRETAEPLQELSDILAAPPRGARAPAFPRWGPYLGDHPCPLRAEGKFWNHEVRAWTPPASLRLLNRQLWRAVDELKFSYALHGRAAPPPWPAPVAEAAAAADGLAGRLVSPFYEAKGVFLAALVATDGRKHTLDLPTRGLSREQKASLAQIERGDILALRGLRALGGQRTWRLPDPSAIVARWHSA